MFWIVCDNRIRTLDARNTFYSRLMSHLEAGYAKLPQSLALSHLSHGNFCINSKYSWFKPFKMNSVIVLVIIKRTLSWCFENKSKGSAADVFDLGDDPDYLDVLKGGRKRRAADVFDLQPKKGNLISATVVRVSQPNPGRSFETKSEKK